MHSFTRPWTALGRGITMAKPQIEHARTIRARAEDAYHDGPPETRRRNRGSLRAEVHKQRVLPAQGRDGDDVLDIFDELSCGRLMVGGEP